MGSLILCHKKRAKQPYEISRVHMRIYTIEELCYYICNNLYLIDYTIINRQLCDWIGDELELSGLAETLREELRQNCSMEQFVLTILKESTIYAAADINRIQNILEHLQNQKDVERTKYKADSLQGSGEYETAILVYQSIINKEWDDSVEKTFYGMCMPALEQPMDTCSCMKRRPACIRKLTASARSRICSNPISTAALGHCLRRST